MARHSHYIRQHTATFRYADKTLHFAFWSHVADNQAPDTIIFLGTGQTGLIPRWVAQSAPAGVVVVEGAPHWHAHPSAHDLYDFMYAYTVAAFRAVCAEFSLASVHVIAQSQAAPGIVRLGHAYAAEVDNMVLIAPLGFTATAFGDTPKTRARTLLKRALHTLMQPTQSPLYDPRNLDAGYMILKAILRESERGASRRKYGAGLSHDVHKDLRALLAQRPQHHKAISFLLGGKDKVFTVSEVQPALEATGITNAMIHILPNMSHLCLGTRAGKEPLMVAVRMVRQLPSEPELREPARLRDQLALDR